jgi:hypothetical protein
VITPPTIRFAVATFDTWADARKVAEELRSGSTPLCEVSYLGLQSASAEQPQLLTQLPFPTCAVPFVCSPGPVAERLSARLNAGTPSLQAALVPWLIPRHAAQLQSAVDSGKIVLWVGLADHAEEQRAYHTLLAAGCGSVGVHDLVGD